MQFLYYLPNKHGADPKHLEEAGLGMLLRRGDASPHVQDLRGVGPDGKSRGQVWAWPNRQPAPVFLPDRQTWRPSACGKHWVGQANESSVGPSDLVREERCLADGFLFTLGDGNRWILPNAMRLPHCWGEGPDGHPQRVPTPEWEQVAQRATWACETILEMLERKRAGESAEMDEATERALLVYTAEMLAINYRVNLSICLKLKLFNDENLLSAAMYTTEAERILSIQNDVAKKNDQATLLG